MKRVSDAMSSVQSIVGPEHTLSQAAQRMVQRGTGAAIVLDGSLQGPGVITERDLMRAIAEGKDPDVEIVEDHMSDHVVTAWPDWPLSRAAALMVKHGIRHVIVFDGSDLAGVLSMRDLVRAGGLEPVREAAEAAAAPTAS